MVQSLSMEACCHFSEVSIKLLIKTTAEIGPHFCDRFWMVCSVKSSTQIYNAWTLVLLPKVTRKLQASDTHHQYMLYIYCRSKGKSVGDGHKCTPVARTNVAGKVARWSGKSITLMN